MKNTKTYSPALAAERSEAEPAAVGAERPNPEVVAIAKRRIFTAEYKQRILAEADKAKESEGKALQVMNAPFAVLALCPEEFQNAKLREAAVYHSRNRLVAVYSLTWRSHKQPNSRSEERR